MGLYDYRHVIANERTCYWFIHRLRWPKGPVCPGRGTARPYAMREQGTVRYRCRGVGGTSRFAPARCSRARGCR